MMARSMMRHPIVFAASLLFTVSASAQESALKVCYEAAFQSATVEDPVLLARRAEMQCYDELEAKCRIKAPTGDEALRGYRVQQCKRKESLALQAYADRFTGNVASMGNLPE